jgi:5,6-dimethylbenzimidazole synthase
MDERLRFDETFRAQLRELFIWRRDVRRFSSEPLPQGALERLLRLACLSPSVGLCQPWRFVVVGDQHRRKAVIDQFKRCNAEALGCYSGALADCYASLKLAGLEEACCQVAVFSDRATLVGHGLGRKTIPEMAEYSTVAAIYTIWLAARAEGIGMGWLSILDPMEMAEILDVPKDWRFIGYFCLGYPQAEFNHPELDRLGWERRRPMEECLLWR